MSRFLANFVFALLPGLNGIGANASGHPSALIIDGYLS